MSFDSFPEQQEAKRLLRAALGDQLAHAYLFHGPPGVGKRRAAIAFAGELLGDAPRVARGAHPDLYVLEPVGDQILIDEIRALRRDLHMRPFEASKRVYLVTSADTMNEDAADALLKDLEEPPPYAVIILVADDLGPLPETIRSRCQPIPFRRLSEAAVRADLAERAPGLEEPELSAIAKLAAGRLDRAERLIDPDSRRRRGRGRPLRPARAAQGRRDPGANGGRRGRLRDRPRDLALLRGIQYRAAAGSGGPVCPAPPRIRRDRGRRRLRAYHL
jgi:DNA polymerase-3 subunit delta'